MLAKSIKLIKNKSRDEVAIKGSTEGPEIIRKP